MIKGIGLDVIELERVKKINDKNDRFLHRVLTGREIELFNNLKATRQIEFLAGRFAAKEAFAKANGTGIGKHCSFQQIEVLKHESGKPLLYFDGVEVNGFVSITHSQTVAAAQVILLDTN